jgi:KaiC/GvpD/RAD55 family RecA-like ATPase
MEYTLSEACGAQTVDPGTNLLVTGPPLAGKRQLAREFVRTGVADEEGTIYITMRDTAGRVESLIDGSETTAPVGIVDCVSEQVVDPAPVGDHVKYASAPTDMTSIGIKFAEFIEEFNRQDGIVANRIVLDSITTLLQYTTLQSVFRFLHAVTTRVAEVDAVGAFLIESTVHDEETMGTIQELFDGVVERRPDGTTAVDLPAVQQSKPQS